MRAILLSAEGFTEVALPDGRSDDHLRVMYELIECQLVDGAGYPDRKHAAWVDDEGMLTAGIGTLVTEVDWHGCPLFGNVLITGFAPETGETIGATMSVEDLAGHIKRVGMLLEKPDL